jgi:SulP family sulfate permease
MPTISRAASGTTAAVGGDAAFENLGGVGNARRQSSQAYHADEQGGQLAVSVPNIGPYLRLLSAGRAHLLELLSKSKYREAPLYLLREKWDGAIDTDNRVSAAKRVRGEFSGVMPARTKKWKDLYGLNFDWALAECLGAGLIELFETRSVGLGVRALT